MTYDCFPLRWKRRPRRPFKVGRLVCTRKESLVQGSSRLYMAQIRFNFLHTNTPQQVLRAQILDFEARSCDLWRVIFWLTRKTAAFGSTGESDQLCTYLMFRRFVFALHLFTYPRFLFISTRTCRRWHEHLMPLA